MVKAVITKGSMQGRTSPLWQYDYGQILQIEGLELPPAYEVHFGNSENGDSTTSIGNADGVVIPDAYLQSGENVYAWLYLHTGESDGETVYHIQIPVKKRAAITDQQPTPVQQDVITQTIAALDAAVEGVPAAIDEALAEAKASGEFDGAPGQDGFSPTATVTKSGKVATITITDKNGTTSATVSDGEDGSDVIDDTAGLGVTNKTWSANKLTSALNDKYEKPSGGIPSSDMASSVQTSLGKADTAYQKPGTGIPASDIADGVIPSLDPQDIADAVSDWCDENITNPDSPPLDRSLSASSAAAPADLVGEIKSAITLAGPVNIPFKIGDATHYIQYANGALSSSASTNYGSTDYIELGLYSKIYYKRAKSTGSTTSVGIAFYNANKQYISGVSNITSQGAIGYVSDLYEPLIPENAVYARFSIVQDTTTYGSFEVKGTPKLTSFVDNTESAIPKIFGLDARQALLNCLSKVAWADESGQDLVNALSVALFPPATLSSISAVYTQDGTVSPTDSLDDLRSDLVVTATYIDGSTGEVNDYQLSGVLIGGDCTITVLYGGKKATFTVTVTDTTLLYALSQETTFTGQASEVIDTNVVVLPEDRDTTFLIDFTPSDPNSNDGCFLFYTGQTSSPYNTICIKCYNKPGTYYYPNVETHSSASGFLLENVKYPERVLCAIRYTEGAESLDVLCMTKSGGLIAGSSTNTGIIASSSKLYIGGVDNTTTFKRFVGTISRFKVYSRKLTDKEVYSFFGMEVAS